MKHRRRAILKQLGALSAVSFSTAGTAMAVDCSGVDDWESGTSYQAGEKVVHGGSLWEADQWNWDHEPGSDDSYQHGANSAVVTAVTMAETVAMVATGTTHRPLM